MIPLDEAQRFVFGLCPPLTPVELALDEVLVEGRLRIAGWMMKDDDVAALEAEADLLHEDPVADLQCRLHRGARHEEGLDDEDPQENRDEDRHSDDHEPTERPVLLFGWDRRGRSLAGVIL